MAARPAVTERAVMGALLGAAVGSALGLPLRGLSPARGQRLFPRLGMQPWVGRRSGAGGDQALMAALALLEGGANPDRFEQALARRLKRWLLTLPPRAGWATLGACLRLGCGLPPARSGLVSTASDPALRALLAGLVWGHDRRRLREWVRRGLRPTHRHDRAYQGGLVLAVAAHLSAEGRAVDGQVLLQRLREVLDGPDPFYFLQLITAADESARRRERVSNLALRLGSAGGLRGDMACSVPCVIQVWLRYPDDYGAALEEIIRAGGATDIHGALLGALVGARTGMAGIPAVWREGTALWPESLAWLRLLGRALVARFSGSRAALPRFHLARRLGGNLVLRGWLVWHRLRRLLPPY